MSEKAKFSLKEFLWPKDQQLKIKRKSHYKSIGLFLVSTATLLRYGRDIADLIYNQALLEETIKSGF